ncbi:MAG: TetR/AcrR family transcriptional regulator [Anaerolineales bacterium]|nr:TetR/AcrR family transcriptional regulator [Anaerolineales bacterium]
MTQQRRGIETRARMLESAIECFSHTGYDATGVAEICHLAGVTKGAFYHHFPSKHAVFLELLEHWLGGLEGQLSSIQAGAATVPEALLRMADLAPVIFAAAKGRLPLYLEFWTQASRDPEVWQATIAPYRRFRDFFATLVQAGIDEGTLRPVDPQTSAQWFVSLAVGLLLQGLLDPEGTDWGRVAQEGMRVLLETMKNDSE